MLPQIVQPGPNIRSATVARNAIIGKFEPARAGREVVLQRQSGTSWVNVATDRQNRRGIAEFKAPARVDGRVATYRVFARAFRGAPRVVSSPSRTDVWGEPDFGDAFNGSTLSSDWSNRVTKYNPEGLRKCSKGSPKAVDVRGGVVRLSVIRDPARRDTKCRAFDQRGKFIGRYSWRLNGHISTAGERSFRYGVSAARVKFQPRRGQHGSFWMQPQTPRNIPGSPKLDGAEIDVIEWFGKGHPAGGLSTHAYYQGKNGRKVMLGDWIRNPDRFLTGGRDSWYSRFHVFSVEWTPSRYIYRIDGKETWRTNRGVSGQPEFLILSLLSSDWELALPRQGVEAAADDESRLGPPLGEVIRKGARDLILTSSLFDQAWYELVAGTRFRSRRAAVEHYLRHVDSGWSPHPLFEAAWLFPHDGWRGSSADPLSHYLRTDARLRRSPHPLIDLDRLTDQLTDPPPD